MIEVLIIAEPRSTSSQEQMNNDSLSGLIELIKETLKLQTIVGWNIFTTTEIMMQ